MKIRAILRCLPLLAAFSVVCPGLHGQQPQQLVFAGLRSIAQQGQITAVQSDASGNLYLLLEQGDGVRLLKTDNAANVVLAQALLGAKGDSGAALALDPSGNVYVAGTTTSATLTATAGAAIPARTDATTNSFVAKFDASLNPIFVTFTGGSRIAATALSATAAAVYVTGITYASNLPVTPNGIQQAPAYGSSQNGFVESFSASGATLIYATYLTGAAGDTTPAAIVADPTGAAYIAGETTATGFPTVAALVPAILSNPTGFLTKLTPAGDGITFSTFIPGPGLSSVALDGTGQTLLVSGSVALGQFPVDTVAAPVIPATYQVLLRLPVDGTAVFSSTLIAPATQSFVAWAPNGGAWVDGVLTAPFLPIAPLATLGNAFAVHVPAGAAIDQTARFGGLPNQSPSYASLPSIVTSIAVDPSGEPLIGGSVQPTASSSLLAGETYDLPLRNAPTPTLPSSINDAELTSANCNGSLCAGSAAYLAKLNPNAGAPALAFSANDLPFITLRNLGTAAANLQISATNATISTNCPTNLNPGAECNALLSGGSAGSLTAASQTIAFPAYAPATSTIAVSPKELDFGIQTSTSPTGTRTLTLSNLGPASQTFVSQIDASSKTASPFSEVSSDCTLGSAAHTKLLAPGDTCHITLGLIAPATSSSDGFLTANWSISSRDVLLTGYSQAASLSVSASEIDFGTQYTNGLRLPRYLYLSNASTTPIAHTALTLPAGSPFTLTDACPETLLAATVCRIRIDYLAAKSTSTDSAVLALDQGLSVLLTGQTLPPQTVNGATVNPNLSVTPIAANFSNAVAVTAISGETQTVTIGNTGTSAFALTLALTGDFTDSTSCTATLAGGQSCTMVLSFVPSQPGTRQGLLAVTAGSGTTPAYISLSATATPILPANNGTLNSGGIALGQPVTQFYKVSQSFSTLTANATGPYTVILVEDAGFGPGQPATSSYAATSTSTCRNCWLGIQFQPTALGPQTGTLTLKSAALGSPYLLNLTGTGLPTTGLLLTPVTQDFGTLPIHSSSGTQLFTLTNLTASASAVTLNAPTLSGDFALVNTPTGGQSCAGTLAYTASCIVAVAFNPTATGTRTGSLTLTASGASATATLTGLATADPGLAISPLALAFNEVPGPTATVQTITLTNTGSTTLTVATPTVTTSSFHPSTTCATLTQSASCTIAVTFIPGPAIAADTLSIPVSGTTYTVALAGNYTAATAGLQIVPNQSEFGPSPIGAQGPTRLFTVNNLTAKSLTLALDLPRQFALTGTPCTALAPNASCTFSAAFVPLTHGDIPGTVTALATPSDGSASLSTLAYLEGYGSSALSNPLTLTGALIVNRIFSFGQVTSGQTLAQTFTLANSNSSGSISIRRISSAPPFLSTTTCATALAPGQTCTVTVSYAPSNQVATGTASPIATSDAGSLVIESDAASSPDTLNLTGQAGPLAVSSPANAAPLATLSLSQSSLTFPLTTVGFASPAQTVTLANTGTVTLHVLSVFTAPDFTLQNSCATLVPGATCAIAVTATPQAAGTRIASLEIATDATTSLEFVSLIATGSPSPLSLSTSNLNFGSVLVGGTASLPLQVTNTGATPIAFTSIAATGDYAATGSCPAPGASLAPAATCSVLVAFKPTAPGTRPGVLSFTTSASNLPLTVALTGIGTQSELVIAPASLAFGSLAIGTTSALSVTLLNNGSVPIANLAFSVAGDYTVTTPCPVTTLTAAASCAVQIAFTPTVAGPRPGSLTVTSSDAGSPASVPLTGTGLPSGSFTLTVNGGTAAAATVVSGQPATYQLTLTPTGGFTGPVALTCTPIAAAQYASCSLLPSTIALNASSQTSTATLSTVASAALLTPGRPLKTVFLCLLFPGLFTLWRGRRDLRRHIPLLLSIVLTAYTVFAAGCGGGSQAVSANVLYAPAGVYQYQVAAASTSGVPITQTVTLNLTVTAR
jgi:hypothetical protein